MSLYRVTTEKLESVPRTTFAEAKLMERKDLQRLLRRDITPLGEDLMVIAEEYGEWEDSKRRIDLLCLSKDAGVVVVEIKRTEDGGHMELQAVRYAAMLSSMTLRQVAAAYAKSRNVDVDSAMRDVMDFLQLSASAEASLKEDIRIILVSANFSTELTTTVLWLNRKGLDITCFRLRPYQLGNDVLIDATQIIPLPEAADYEVKQRAEEQEKQKMLSARHELFRKFWGQLVARSLSRTQLLSGRSTSADQWISTGIGRGGFSLSLSLTQERAQVEIFIRVGGDMDRSKAAFDALSLKKDAIHSHFGGSLDWQDLPGRNSCRICTQIPGGWKTPEADWPALQDLMIDAMIRLEAALRKPIQELEL